MEKGNTICKVIAVIWGADRARRSGKHKGQRGGRGGKQQ